ncbi:MAG TPA: methyl-coenzyme M reductase subunit beta, partial [Methanofastidiosum sp.]|nr:methyl-coenzyme M reductase subunit beta [Methanofastidiosum sp.]
MPKYSDKIDLYSDRGKLVESGVPLEALSPLKNEAIQSIVSKVVRTVAVDLKGTQSALATGALGGKGQIIMGREMKLDVVGKAPEIKKRVEEILKIDAKDDTLVTLLGN